MPRSQINSVPRLAAGALLATVLTVSAFSFATGPAAQAADASTPVDLKTTEQFAVLAGAGITNTGSTTIQGDIGSFPTTDQTIPDVTLDGTNQGGNDVTQQAKVDLVDAYNEARDALPPTAVETELGGRSLVAGVYKAPVELGLTGTLTLDGGRADGSASSSVFIFQAPTTLITEVNSSVVLTGGAQACNIFWQVGSAATFKTGSSFKGTVMANTEAITAGQGATFEGRLLARTAAVTLINNTITAPDCEAGGAADGSVEVDADDAGDDTSDADADADSDDGDTTGDDADTDSDTDADADADSDADAGADADADTDADGTDAADDVDADAGADSTGSAGDADGPTTTDAPGTPTTDLPDTGAPSAWFVLAGLGLVAGGVVLVRQKQRQAPLHRA